MGNMPSSAMWEEVASALEQGEQAHESEVQQREECIRIMLDALIDGAGEQAGSTSVRALDRDNRIVPSPGAVLDAALRQTLATMNA